MMRALLLASALAISQPAFSASPDGQALRLCISAASQIHHVPPGAMIVLLMVEGGRLGSSSGNTNGTADLGPFQVNEIWIPRIARYWNVSEAQARDLVQNDLCSNAEAAAWIFGMGLRDANNNLWEGVARYHSMNPAHQQNYLSKALGAVLRMRKVSHG